MVARHYIGPPDGEHHPCMSEVVLSAMGPTAMNIGDYRGWTPLHEAARSGQYAKVLCALAHTGIDVLLLSISAITAAGMARMNGHHRVADAIEAYVNQEERWKFRQHWIKHIVVS